MPTEYTNTDSLTAIDHPNSELTPLFIEKTFAITTGNWLTDFFSHQLGGLDHQIPWQLRLHGTFC